MKIPTATSLDDQNEADLSRMPSLEWLAGIGGLGDSKRAKIAKAAPTLAELVEKVKGKKLVAVGPVVLARIDQKMLAEGLIQIIPKTVVNRDSNRKKFNLGKVTPWLSVNRPYGEIVSMGDTVNGFTIDYVLQTDDQREAVLYRHSSKGRALADVGILLMAIASGDYASGLLIASKKDVPKDFDQSSAKDGVIQLGDTIQIALV